MPAFNSFLLFLTFSLFTHSTLVLAAPPPIVLSCTKSKTAAITFDDGPWQYMRHITDTLSNAGAKGTFFLNGKNYGCIYDQNLASSVQYAYSKGHQIASHTWSHANLNNLSKSQVITELDKIDTALKKIIGVKPKFVRPPYGSYNTQARQVAADRGVILVNWDVDSQDSAGASPSKSKTIFNDFVKKHPPSLMTLNHETYKSSAYEVLPYLIDLLKKNGYRMVTVAECLGQSPYLSVGSPSPRDNTWKC